MTEPGLSTETVNGRLCYAATAWWARHHPDEHRLTCVHGLELKDPCDACVAEAGSIRTGK